MLFATNSAFSIDGMNGTADVAASLVLASSLTLAIGAYVIASVAAGRVLETERVQREAALPLVGKAPMHAVYRALMPIGRGIAAVGISANAVSVAALGIAGIATVAFATGHFGIAAAIACVASLADGLDGFIARITKTQSRFGQVLDTTIDRYVDALFLGGIAMYVHLNAALLLLCLAAIVGSFMVSYASSVERELGVTGAPATMRRAHRLVYLLGASAIAPLVGHAFVDVVPNVELVPVFIAVGAIAVIGNYSAVRRLLGAARIATARESAPDSAPEVEAARPAHAGGARR